MNNFMIMIFSDLWFDTLVTYVDYIATVVIHYILSNKIHLIKNSQYISAEHHVY